MAAIDLDDCDTSHNFTNGLKEVKIVTPSTADGGDTIDVSELFDDGCVAISHSATDGESLAATGNYGTTITLPGSATDEVFTVIAKGN